MSSYLESTHAGQGEVLDILLHARGPSGVVGPRVTLTDTVRDSRISTFETGTLVDTIHVETTIVDCETPLSSSGETKVRHRVVLVDSPRCAGRADLVGVGCRVLATEAQVGVDVETDTVSADEVSNPVLQALEALMVRNHGAVTLTDATGGANKIVSLQVAIN